ncbi:MAG: signal peptidase I [Bacteroidetes bacterium]|nr:MAG: signal peptidase I [Bacteroidota bacterium]
MKSMKFLKSSILFGLLCLSCSKPPGFLIMPDSSMETTITKGTRLSIEPKAQISRNDLIAFYLPAASEITCRRVVGIPGDKIEINKGVIFINNHRFDRPASGKTLYSAYCKDSTRLNLLSAYEHKIYNDHYWMVYVTKDQLQQILNQHLTDSIHELGFDSTYAYREIIRTNTSKGFNHYYFGPIFLPKIGDTLTADNQALINHYMPIASDAYVVSENYFFCIGDKFSDAMDSRVFGLVPKSKILGIVKEYQKPNPANSNLLFKTLRFLSPFWIYCTMPVYRTFSVLQVILVSILKIAFLSVAAYALYHYPENPVVSIIVAAFGILAFLVTGSDEIIVYKDAVEYRSGSILKRFREKRVFKISDIRSVTADGLYDTGFELAKGSNPAFTSFNKVEITLKNGEVYKFQTPIYISKLKKAIAEIGKLIQD